MQDSSNGYQLIAAPSRSEQISRNAAAFREYERRFNELSQILGAGSIIAGGINKPTGGLLGAAAATAGVIGAHAGNRAAELEKEAEKEKESEKEQSKVAPPTQPTAIKKSSAPNDSADRIGRIREGRTYGGRASEFRPERRDMISRTC